MLLNAWILDVTVVDGQVTGFTQVDEIPTQLFPSFAAALARRGTLPATR